jgi:hypothetical protein
VRRAAAVLLLLGVIFGVDLCVHATPEQRGAFGEAVRRTTAYRSLERLIPDDWFEEWSAEWREKRKPHEEDTTAARR